VEARLRPYVWLGWGVAGLGGLNVGWLVGLGDGAATANYLPRSASGNRASAPDCMRKEAHREWETCHLRSSSTPAPSRPEVPGMLTASSPHPVRHIAGAIRLDHPSWDRVQGGVYGASSLYTSS
jgi:hypothetical protein